AEGIGLNFDRLVDSNDLEILWQPPVESSLDAVGTRILQAVERRGVRRLFIDGFNALAQCAAYPERVPQFFAALSRELHARGVTTVHSAELRAILAPQVEAPVRGISPLLDNLVLLRFVEGDSRMRRAIAVLKMRDSSFDATLRELVIDDGGIRVGAEFGDTTTAAPVSSSRKSDGAKPKPRKTAGKPRARKAAAPRRRG
ncbi:MAG TPA: ATPase domain-containing protein, partial [Polyangiaceae bacterium]|nr:ATPase domain-containing protein [Polyangiaceae bacterium]